MAKKKSKIGWAIYLQCTCWLIVLFSCCCMYYSVYEYSTGPLYYSTDFHKPGTWTYIDCNLVLLMSYFVYELAIFLLTCMFFTGWFALKSKSINFRFIYLVTALLLSRAVTLFQIPSSYDIQYTIHQNHPWFILIEIFCWGMLAYVLFGFYKELTVKKTYLLASRILILIGLIYMTFSTFNYRRKMLVILGSRERPAAERFGIGISNRDLKYLQYLLSNGVDINSRFEDTNLTPLMDACFSQNNLHIFKFLIANGADLSLKDINDNTALFDAVFFQKLDIVKFLIANGAKINIRNKDGHSPLSIANMQNFPNMITLLESHGAKLNKSEYKSIALLNKIKSEASNLSEIKKMLQNGANPNYKFIKGSTPLIYAVRKMRKDLMQLLLQYKADANLGDRYGRTPLSYVHTLEVWYMLINAGADINAIDRDENSLLMFPYRKNIANLLLSKGINVNAKNLAGSTALHNAVYTYGPDMKLIYLLLSKGVKCAPPAEQSSASLRCETPFLLAAKPLLIKAQ